MSRARVRKEKSKPSSGTADMDDDFVDQSLKNTFADLEPPKVSKFSETNALLNKVLKDKSKKEKEQQKRAREAAKRKQAGSDSDGDEGELEEEATAKKAKLEDCRAAMKRKIRESSGPPVFRQVLFPNEAARPPLQPDDALVRELSAEFGSTSLDGAVMAAELLLGGWFEQHYLRQGSMSAPAQRHLFKLATQSTDSEVARKAYETLSAVLSPSASPHHLLGRQEALDSKGGDFYGRRPAAQAVECRLHDADFVAALAVLGYREPDAPPIGRGAKRSGIDAAAPVQPAAGSGGNSVEAVPGWDGSGQLPPLGNIRLLLRLLAQVCRLQAAGTADVLSGGIIQQLISAILNLRMDPICTVLAADLEAALAGLLDACPEADWGRKFGDLAARIAGLGGSHRGAVELLRLLPAMSSRADLLRSHAAANLLPTLLVAKGKKPVAAAPKSRGSPAPIDPEALVAAQPWYEAGEGHTRLARAVNQGALSIWELQSAIELVDLLLWPYVKAAKESGEDMPHAAFMTRWRNFCQKLSVHVAKDDQGAALRLLITTIITRDNAGSL